MTTFLLDANVRIALTTREHVHHERVTSWAIEVERFAVGPIVEGALLRFAVRLGVGIGEAREALRLVRDRAGYEFWPDSMSYVDVDLHHVRGHRQITDAYLASLAASRPDCKLATLDEGPAQAHPSHTLLVPAA